jgi:hypothetical protein
MKLIELVMITKNSGEILRKCLRSNKDFIDYWTILDTGSTDDTISIINEELKDKEGKLFHGEFTDFSQARNQAIELSSKSCKYILMLDDSYIVEGQNELKSILLKSKRKCFSIKIGNYRNLVLQNDYYSNRIFSSHSNYKYIYRVHEYLNIPEKEIEIIHSHKIFINDIETYEHKVRSATRLSNDIHLLLQDLQDKPNDPHVLYYLAKTYYNLENYELSLKYFNQLEKEKQEEYRFAGLYESACIKLLLSNNSDEFFSEMVKMNKLFPKRVESLYKLSILHRDKGDYVKANEIIESINKVIKPNLHYTILEHDLYDYFIPYLDIENKIAIGKYQVAVDKLKHLLFKYPTNQPLLNMKYALCHHNESSVYLSVNKTMVIHTGGEETIFHVWNPQGDLKISGSEFMAINLGEQFAKLGYRVIIFGCFQNDEFDFQCIKNNVQYIDYTGFSEFCLKYVIDYLIVSRYTSNLVYYDNVKNVYLWVHDVLPLTKGSKSFQIHQTKFKKIIAVSNWQKNNIVNNLQIPENKIIVSRNAIIPDRFFNKQVEKIPYRFIFTSDPSRGLDNLLRIIPKIKEKYPETTLYIFANKENIDNECLKIINSLEYVFLNARLNQDQIAIEFLKSDIWFYPTHFKETYCISAIEAMCSKCLVVTAKLAALTEIVECKGILYSFPYNEEEVLKKLFFTLERKNLKNLLIDRAYQWAITQTFQKLAHEWIEDIF